MTLIDRAWFLLTGRCRTYRPDRTGLCRVCRIPGASMKSPNERSTT